jgi:O-methyltransferase involved in polyketide biosynthesis
MNQAGSPGAVRSAADDSPLQTAPGNLHVPNPARVYDALLGGKDNFAADRAVADRLAAAKPALRHNVRANRAYLGRVVRYLAGEAGIRQFLDLGTGLPSLNNVHEVAQRVALESRIVYVDNDPIVIAHARAMLASSPEGATAFLSADIRDPESILEQAAKTLDLDRPVAVILLGVLYMIPDAHRPYETVAEYLHAIASGSYLAVSHPASDISAASAARAARQYDAAMPTTQTNRSRAEVGRFFDGLELLEPGVVQLNKWRPDLGDVDPGVEISSWAALGRKR